MSAPPINGNGFGGGPLAPPQNVEAEQSVLGAVLLSDTALPAVVNLRREEERRVGSERQGRL